MSYRAKPSPILALILGRRNSTNGLLRMKEGGPTMRKLGFRSLGWGGELYFIAEDVEYPEGTRKHDFDISHGDGRL